MPEYRVEITFDMGMSSGSDTHVFDAADDEAAKRYMDENKGGTLSPIMRDVQFKRETLSRVVI